MYLCDARSWLRLITIHKESSVDNSIGQDWSKRENFGKTDQAIDYVTATLHILYLFVYNPSHFFTKLYQNLENLS